MVDGLRVRAEFVGEAAARRALDELVRRFGDLTPVWREILADFKAEEKAVFESEGQAIGSRWAPLSPVYAAWKQRHFGPSKILQRTGRLRAAAEGRSSEFEERVAPLALEFRILSRTAQFHQARRPVARMGEFEKRRWYRMLVAHAERAAAAARAA